MEAEQRSGLKTERGRPQERRRQKQLVSARSPLRAKGLHHNYF